MVYRYGLFVQGGILLLLVVVGGVIYNRKKTPPTFYINDNTSDYVDDYELKSSIKYTKL